MDHLGSWISRVARLAVRPIAWNSRFFITMYVLGVMCAMLTKPHHKGAELYDNLWLELALDLYLVCVVLALIPRYVRAWVRALLYAVLYAVAIVDVYCFWKFGSTLTPTMLMLVSETDSREAGEFLRTYVNLDVISSPLGWIFLLLVIQTLVGYRHLLANLLTRPQRLYLRAWRRNAGARFRSMRLDVVAGMAVVAVLVWAIDASWNNKVLTHKLMTASTIGQVEHILTEKDRANLYTPIYRLLFSVRSNMLAAQQVGKCVEAAKSAQVDSCSYKSPTVVLIIGESYGKHHAQLYGYRLPTTPLQMELEERGLLTPFSDVVSCWNLTSFVFKNFLSMHVVGQEGEWCDYPLFPQLFRKAGYKVTFLTNQFLPKAKEAVYDFSGGFFLNDPTLASEMFDYRNDNVHRFDEGLLKDYDKLVEQGKIEKDGHNFIIFHLIGQHVSYRTRTPNNRRVFGPDAYEEARPELDVRHRRMIADYDNAVRYNDSIVTTIIRRFENQEAVVVYMPDHGEECYEPGRDFICRNHSAAVDWPLAHYEFEVPFWIYCSHKYAVRHPEVFKAVKDSKDRRFMTDALPHLMLGLAGIASKDYHAEYDLLSPDYDETRPRILKASADYDKLREENNAKQ